MELQMQHAPAWMRRRPDWPVAAVAGFAAGAVLMVLELFWAAAMASAGPWQLPHMVAAILLGPGILQGPTVAFDPGIVAAALLTHYVLGIVFGLIFAALVASLHRDVTLGRAEWVGALFGVVLYFFDFYVLTGLFPWFVELRGWSTLIAHLAFGLTAALLYWKLARRDALES